jgi:hypothetical protein
LDGVDAEREEMVEATKDVEEARDPRAQVAAAGVHAVEGADVELIDDEFAELG